MKTSLVLGPDIELPFNAVAQKLAFIAISGAGKTYTATKLAEEMWRAGCQFVAIDPVGTWYGLRLREDGKTPSDIDIPVFGGLHGDIPLDASHGPMLAGLVATKGLRCVLDVSTMRKGDRKRFVTSFLEELFHLKKTHRGPLHIFFEEAQFFAPQMSGEGKGEIADLLGAMQDICCVGRNFGIGHSLITQRPQSVQKSILNQAQALFIFQTSGKQERDAIGAWASECGMKADDVDLDMLPTLETGHAVVWSPKWLKRMNKVHIAKKTTYDASSTPEWTDQVHLQPIDLLALGEEMKIVVAEAEANDPKKLLNEVKDLRAKLAEKEACAHEGKPTGLVHEDMYEKALLELEGREEEIRQHKERFNAVMAQVDLARTRVGGMVEMAQMLQNDVIAAHAEALQGIIPGGALRTMADSIKADEDDHAIKDIERRFAGTVDEKFINGPEPKQASEPSKLPLGARRMLEVVVTHPHGLKVAQVRMLTHLKQSGTFDKYKSMLRTAGHIEMEGELFKPTKQGVRLAKSLGMDLDKPSSVPHLLAKWRETIDGAGKTMFDVIVNHGRRGVTRVDLALKATITQSGTFDKYLSQIRSTGLFVFDKGKGLIKVRDDLKALCGEVSQ